MNFYARLNARKFADSRSIPIILEVDATCACSEIEFSRIAISVTSLEGEKGEDIQDMPTRPFGTLTRFSFDDAQVSQIPSSHQQLVELEALSFNAYFSVTTVEVWAAWGNRVRVF